MVAPRTLALALIAAASVPARAGPCLLCDAPALSEPAPARPLSIEIDARLEFGRLALSGAGGGALELAPDGSARSGGALVDLGGMRLTATVTLSGEPGRLVRIDWPERVALRGSAGGTVVLTGLTSDQPNPVRLDSAGGARFRLGGRLEVAGDASGEFRGPVPITADYE